MMHCHCCCIVAGRDMEAMWGCGDPEAFRMCGGIAPSPILEDSREGRILKPLS